MNLHIKYKTLLNSYNVTSPLRLSHFFAQVEHESGLKPIQENLNYSSKRLGEVFKKYFPTIEEQKRYANNPQLIANKVYSNRMGNGNELSNDGWKYSGKGFLQITGKDNYSKLTLYTGIDFVTHPEKLLEEANAMISALWYWNMISGNKYADKDDILTITKRINGGTNGLEMRKKSLVKYKELFNFPSNIN